MSLVGLAGLSLAFLAPLPPQRPEPPRPLPGNAWAASLIMVCVIVFMVMPMITIWGFHRPEQSFRTQCAARGGHAVFTGLDGSGPRRCEPGQAQASR